MNGQFWLTVSIARFTAMVSCSNCSRFITFITAEYLCQSRMIWRRLPMHSGLWYLSSPVLIGCNKHSFSPVSSNAFLHYYVYVCVCLLKSAIDMWSLLQTLIPWTASNLRNQKPMYFLSLCLSPL